MDGGSGEEGGDEAGLIGKTAPDFTFATLEGGRSNTIRLERRNCHS